MDLEQQNEIARRARAHSPTLARAADGVSREIGCSWSDALVLASTARPTGDERPLDPSPLEAAIAEVAEENPPTVSAWACALSDLMPGLSWEEATRIGLDELRRRSPAPAPAGGFSAGAPVALADSAPPARGVLGMTLAELGAR
jgi:hypothetical protein